MTTVTIATHRQSDALTKTWLTSLTDNLKRRGWNVKSVIAVNAADVVSAASSHSSDLVVAQGFDLCFSLAKLGYHDFRLWSVPLDRPYRDDAFSHSDFTALTEIARTSTRIIVASEEQRSILDSEIPTSSSKVRVLPLPSRAIDQPPIPHLSKPLDVADCAEIHIHEPLFSDDDVHALSEFGQFLRSQKVIPRIYIHSSGDSAVNLHHRSDSSEVENVIRGLPGAVNQPPNAPGNRNPITSSHDRVDAHWLLLPLNPVARAHGQLIADSEHLTAITLSHLSLLGDNFEVAKSSLVESADTATDDALGNALDPFDEVIELPVVEADRPIRLVVAGSDFKFAGDLVDSLLGDSLFDVRFDVFKHHSQEQPRASEPYAAWADVVLCEFAVRNAVWYSHAVAPHQTLIVHLHGFELLSDWIEEMDINRVDRVVVASEYYRHKAHELRGWPLDKISVVPNAVNPFDFVRPKSIDARFHLGLVGMVPILKRPDRAIDLLEKLLQVDPRYTLHIRGHAPWNYTWEWKKAAHQDAYRELYERIGTRPELLRSISFEPFAPDMANWFRRIGWVLSPSTRETFHLASIEGATSGAVPLAWEREGARDIIGHEWTFPTTDAIVDFVTLHNSSNESFRHLSLRAQAGASRYRSDLVARRWRETILDAREVSASDLDSAVPRGHAGAVFLEVDALVSSGEFDEAKGALDRHIQVTKNDKSALKTMEMFVRGLLALDARRIDLLPPPSPRIHSCSSKLHSNSHLQVVRVTEDADHPQIPDMRIDPSILERTIGVVGFGYTGDQVNQPRNTTFSGSVVTDPLAKPVDFRVEVDDRLRFDRWTEVVAAELRAHLREGSASIMLIDGPWHIALPAALASTRAGIPYIWAPPVESIVPAVRKISNYPYSGDVIAQFVGLLITRAKAIVAPERDTAHHAEILLSLPHILPVPTTDSGLEVKRELFSSVQDLGENPTKDHVLGALNGTRPIFDTRPSKYKVGIVANDRIFASWNETPGAKAIRVREHDSLDATIDMLVVDESALSFTDQNGRPTPQWLRDLFDHARGLGIPGIFNSKSNVGGDHPNTIVAEKADAITGTRAVLTTEVLARNPNSITRVSSETLVGGPQFDMDHAAATLGFGRGFLEARRTSETSAPDSVEASTTSTQNSKIFDSTKSTTPARLLRQETLPDSSNGVSLVLATHLGADRIGRMLDSIGAQSIDPSFLELVVVRNGPDDGTREIVDEFARRHPSLSTISVWEEKSGASSARNRGLEMATRDYITFIDDDDEIEPNYLLNMWLSADTHLVVAAPLRDVTPEGHSLTDIPNNRRLSILAGRETELSRVSGLLSLNACKLIPASIAKSIKYATNLKSGEDVAYMSNLLLHDLRLVPADSAPDSAYVRHIRPNSVSRRELDREFAVNQRLSVIRSLEEVRLSAKRSADGCIRALQRDQVSFVNQYVRENPEDGHAVVAEVMNSGITIEMLKERYSTLFAMAEELIRADVEQVK